MRGLAGGLLFGAFILLIEAIWDGEPTAELPEPRARPDRLHRGGGRRPELAGRPDQGQAGGLDAGGRDRSGSGSSSGAASGRDALSARSSARRPRSRPAPPPRPASTGSRGPATSAGRCSPAGATGRGCTRRLRAGRGNARPGRPARRLGRGEVRTPTASAPAGASSQPVWPSTAATATRSTATASHRPGRPRAPSSTRGLRRSSASRRGASTIPEAKNMKQLGNE